MAADFPACAACLHYQELLPAEAVCRHPRAAYRVPDFVHARVVEKQQTAQHFREVGECGARARYFAARDDDAKARARDENAS